LPQNAQARVLRESSRPSRSRIPRIHPFRGWARPGPRKNSCARGSAWPWKTTLCGFRGKNYPLLRQSTLVMEWMVQIWNNPKRLDHLAATWMLAWFLIWLAPWLPGFRIPLFDGSPQNMFGGLERGLLYAVGFAPFFVLELRRRRILRSARA